MKFDTFVLNGCSDGANFQSKESIYCGIQRFMGREGTFLSFV
jgi:hypothetical protein